MPLNSKMRGGYLKIAELVPRDAVEIVPLRSFFVFSIAYAALTTGTALAKKNRERSLLPVIASLPKADVAIYWLNFS